MILGKDMIEMSCKDVLGIVLFFISLGQCRYGLLVYNLVGYIAYVTPSLFLNTPYGDESTAFHLKAFG